MKFICHTTCFWRVTLWEPGMVYECETGGLRPPENCFKPLPSELAPAAEPVAGPEGATEKQLRDFERADDLVLEGKLKGKGK